MTADPVPAPEVLFEDPHLVAVNKPAPLLTQAPAGIPSLEAAVKAYIKTKYAKPAGVYLGVPHRLDRPVTGVVVFARNTKAAQRVHAQFHDRLVRKVYWAVVAGSVEPASGVWADWLRKVPDEPRAVRAAETDPGAKLAELDFRVLAAVPGGTVVELAPRTGRMHQLRVQTALRGHPVFGDDLYGSVRPFGPASADPRDKSNPTACGTGSTRDHVIALHARRLTLTHPFTKAELTFVAPLPPSWAEFGDFSLAES